MNDEFMKDLEAAEAAATANETEAAFPEFQNAIVFEDKLPKMPDYIIDGVLLETHKMLLSGPSKAGKTWCLINLAESVACGGYWIGHKCAQRKVLFIDFETAPRTLQRRITVVAKAKQLNQKMLSENLVIWPLRGTTHSLDEIALELIKRCEKGEFGLVIIDPAYMVQDGDENNARDIRIFFAALDRICVSLECAVVISHHHSKGAQGLKSAIDRSSGSGVFGRAPDAVLDLTELVIDEGTFQMAMQSKKLASVKHLTGWRMSYTLREFEPHNHLDLWFEFPLHEADSTGLLADCKPNFGGQSEAAKLRKEAENHGKIAQLDAACMTLLDGKEYCFRDELEEKLGWSTNTVNRWVDQSEKYMRMNPGSGKARIVRRPEEVEGVNLSN